MEQLQASGARAILVGESLMRQENIAAKVRELGGQAEQGEVAMSEILRVLIIEDWRSTRKCWWA